MTFLEVDWLQHVVPCRPGKRFSCPNGCLRHSSESSPTERNGSFYQANHQQQPQQQQQHRSHGVSLSRFVARRCDMTLINPWPQVTRLLVTGKTHHQSTSSNYSTKLSCLRGLGAFSCRETFSQPFVLYSRFSIDSCQKERTEVNQIPISWFSQDQRSPDTKTFVRRVSSRANTKSTVLFRSEWSIRRDHDVRHMSAASPIRNINLWESSNIPIEVSSLHPEPSHSRTVMLSLWCPEGWKTIY